jgi:hypothetical protein
MEELIAHGSERTREERKLAHHCSKRVQSAELIKLGGQMPTTVEKHVFVQTAQSVRLNKLSRLSGLSGLNKLCIHGASNPARHVIREALVISR